MKIIATDNFDRETVADRLVSSGLDKATGTIMLRGLRASVKSVDPWWYELVEDDHRLSKGMEDLV